MRQLLLTISTLILLLISFKGLTIEAPQLGHSTISQEVKTLQTKTKGLSPKVLKLALRAYHNADHAGLVKNHHLTVIDYSAPSTKKRLWVIDMKHQKVPFYTYVAHGKGSGNVTPKKFSNRRNSLQSSLGLYVTKQPFVGRHVGYALQIEGLESGINNNALRRGVVVHGASYVNKSYINRNGRAGRSWGCPAVPKPLIKPLVKTIKNGSIIFAYYPQQSWLSHSKFLAA